MCDGVPVMRSEGGAGTPRRECEREGKVKARRSEAQGDSVKNLSVSLQNSCNSTL